MDAERISMNLTEEEEREKPPRRLRANAKQQTHGNNTPSLIPSSLSLVSQLSFHIHLKKACAFSLLAKKKKKLSSLVPHLRRFE